MCNAGQIGPVDVLVNSAGIVGPNKPLLDTTADEWRRLNHLDYYDVRSGGLPEEAFFVQLRRYAAQQFVYVGKEERTLRLKSDGWKIAYSPNGQRLVTTCEDGSVDMWDAALNAGSTPLVRFPESVYAAAWSPDGTYLAAAATDGQLAVVDCVVGEPVATFEGHDSAIYAVCWRPDSKQVAT